MLSIIRGLPDHVFAVRATGEVDKEDLKGVLLPGLAVLTEKHGEIYYLLVLKTDVENFTAGAWVQDLIAGVKHFTQWKKMAIVSDQKTVEKITNLFSYITPGEAKGFELSELKKAKKWVSEKVTG